MGETTAKTKYEFTEQDLEDRTVARGWLGAAQTVLEERKAKVDAQLRRMYSRDVGSRAVAPSIWRAPEHIKNGTQIDQEIWRAEESVDEEYQEDPRELEDEEMELEARERDLEFALQDSSDNSVGGALRTIETGVWEEVGGSLRIELDLDELRDFTGKYVQLEANRQKSIAEQGVDPLQDQVRATFRV